jgi:hypothetical protein
VQVASADLFRDEWFRILGEARFVAVARKGLAVPSAGSFTRGFVEAATAPSG